MVMVVDQAVRPPGEWGFEGVLVGLGGIFFLGGVGGWGFGDGDVFGFMVGVVVVLCCVGVGRAIGKGERRESRGSQVKQETC